MGIEIKRGDILYADLGVKYQGSMQGGIRPVVVVSNNRANRYSVVITVVPLSSKVSKTEPSYPCICSCTQEQRAGTGQYCIM